VKYTTDLTDPVWFYLRGEEYSAQVAEFVSRITDGSSEDSNSFETAAATDKILTLIAADAARPTTARAGVAAHASTRVPEWLRARRWRSRRAAAASPAGGR
jgi:hypothetical protein